MRVTLDELAGLSKARFDELDVIGGGTLADATIGPLRCRQLHFQPSMFRSFTFRRCRFVDVRVSMAWFTRTTLIDCSVVGIQVSSVMRFPQMVRSSVDGVMQGALGPRDAGRSNDFRLVRGVNYWDGVDLSANLLPSPGPDTFILRRNHPNWPLLVERAKGDIAADSLVKNLSGRQEWAVIYRELTPSSDWAFLAEHFGEKGIDKAPLAAAEDQLDFGYGEIAVFSAAPQAAHITPASAVRLSGAHTTRIVSRVADALHLASETHWRMASDSTDYFVVGLDEELRAALSRLDGEGVRRVASASAASDEDEGFELVEDWHELVLALHQHSLSGRSVYIAFLA